MLRSKFAVQLTQAKRFAGVVSHEYGFEFSTLCQTRGCRVSLSRIGWTKPHSRTSVSRSAAAEINSGRALSAFLKGGPVAALSLYGERTNPITKLGAAIRRVG